MKYLHTLIILTTIFIAIPHSQDLQTHNLQDEGSYTSLDELSSETVGSTGEEQSPSQQPSLPESTIVVQIPEPTSTEPNDKTFSSVAEQQETNQYMTTISPEVARAKVLSMAVVLGGGLVAIAFWVIIILVFTLHSSDAPSPSLTDNTTSPYYDNSTNYTHYNYTGSHSTNRSW